MSTTDELKFSQPKTNNSNNLSSSNNKESNIDVKISTNNNKKKSLQKRPRNKDNNSINSLQSDCNETATSKIDYRHYKLYPIEEIVPIQNFDKDISNLYWFVAYDKLIKTKKILKILNYYLKPNEKPIYTENNLKIKCIKIEDFELFFVKGFNKPFVRPNKESFILAKLYLLSVKEINVILNYLNKTRDKVDLDNYINLNDVNNENTSCEFLDIRNKLKDDDISYPYCFLYNIGKFMNISMILITNTFNYIDKGINDSDKLLIYSLPSSRKLYKIIKLLIKSFPEYSPNYFIEYLIKRNLYQNFNEKKNEILKLLSLLNFSAPNKLLLNKVLRETITGIQTNSSISGSSLHIDSDEGSKCPIKVEKQERISLLKINNNNNKGLLKNSIKSNNGININGQIGTINYLSTNQTMRPSVSIKTFKNSFKNNLPNLSIPSEINNAKKEKESFGIYLTSSTNMPNRLSYNLQQKEKNNESKKKNNKKVGYKINNDKENIDINNILNKKKGEFFYGQKISNKNLANTITIGRNKMKDKICKLNNTSKIYHTPVKKKKIKYYK